MTKSNRPEDRLKAIPDDPSTGGARAFRTGQLWLWQRLGLVAGMIVGLLIAVLTLTPLPAGPPMGGGLDKLYHFFGFAALVFPLILTDARRWYWVVPAAIAFGGAIELIQPSVGRTAEWLDFGANVTGVLAGAALAEILHDRLRARFFAIDTPPETDEDDEAEARRLEAMRVDLMDELRVVLREELSSLKREGPVKEPPDEPREAQNQPQTDAELPERPAERP
ncbi:MAG: hypothetical protein ACK4GT_14700 [Pararhodobacter sp.]